jgi:hypothetical protein
MEQIIDHIKTLENLIKKYKEDPNRLKSLKRQLKKAKAELKAGETK